jgi:L-iditol 2-dehydrogenase
MKAAILEDLNSIVVREVPMPVAGKGEMLLKVKSCAVCGSDVRIFHHGNPRVVPPVIIGHEVAGEVVAVGEGVDSFKVGDRVAIGADVPCGKCETCKQGFGNNCAINYAIGYQYSGGFCEYMLLNETTVSFGPVHKIPDGVSYDAAALAEPLACAINGFEVGRVTPGSSLLIVGAGPIGCMMIELARHWGVTNVIMAQRGKARLEIARQFGADAYICTSDEDLVTRSRELTGGKGPDCVITSCGSVEVHEQAIEAVAQRGCVNLFGGLAKGTRNMSVASNTIHYKECLVTGSHGSTPRQHKMALDFIARGYVNTEKYITHHFSLDDIEQALAANEDRAGLKVVVNP